MPTSSMYLTPSRAKNNGITTMKKTSDICPYDMVAAGASKFSAFTKTGAYA